jgi:DNA-binding MarR family transcriptional regulator
MEDQRAASFVRFLDEFARLRGRVQTAFGAVDDDSGLSELESVVLNAVAGASAPPTVPQIGRSLGHARQVIQRAANALIARGLIEMVANPDHKRAHLLVPTQLGSARKAEADGKGMLRAAALTEGLELETIETGVAALRRIRESLEHNLRRHNAGQ